MQLTDDNIQHYTNYVNNTILPNIANAISSTYTNTQNIQTQHIMCGLLGISYNVNNNTEVNNACKTLLHNIISINNTYVSIATI